MIGPPARLRLGAARCAGALEQLAAAGLDVRLVRTLVDLEERACFEIRVAGRRAALKLDRDRARAEREGLAHRAAREGGLQVPRILWQQPGDPSLLVVEWLAGTSLEEGAAGWLAAGRALRRLHALAPPAGLPSQAGERSWREFLLDWVAREARRCIDLGALPSEEVLAIEGRLLERLDDLPEPESAFLHGDLQPAHVLLDGAEVALIDWGDAATGDPLWDLAVLLLDHVEQRSELLAGYAPAPPLEARAGAHLDTYRATRYLGEIPWLVERGFDAGASRRGLRSCDLR